MMTTRGASAVSESVKNRPFSQRDFQRFEIARRHVELIRRDDRFARLRRVAFRNDDAAARIPAERQVTGDARGFDPGQRAHSRKRALHVGSQRRIVRISRAGQADAAGEHVRRLEAWTHREEALKAREQESRSDDEDEGERHLGDDERTAKVARRLAGGAGPALFAEDTTQVHPGELERRPCADDDAKKNGGRQRHRQHHRVDPDLVSPRQIGKADPLHGVEAERSRGEGRAPHRRSSAPSLR